MAFSFEPEALSWEEFLSSLPDHQFGEWHITHSGVIKFHHLGHQMGVIAAARFNRMAKLPCQRVLNNWRKAAEDIRLPIDLGQRIHDAVKAKPGHDPRVRAAIIGRVGLKDIPLAVVQTT